MRICETKSGKLIEMQSDAREGTLIANAASAGYSPDEVMEREVTPEEWQDILAAQPKDETAIAKARLAEIDAKSIRSIREWIAAQPNAPQMVKDYEAQAVTEREKLQK